MRRTAVARALAGVAFASAAVVACGGGDATRHASTSTPVGDAPTSTPVSVEEPADLPSDPRIGLKVVEAMLPSPAATSAALGLVPGAWVLKAGVGGPWDPEGFRLVRPGITAGWIAQFEADPRLELSLLELDLFFHATPEDAERTYQFHRQVFWGLSGEDERDTIGDAVSIGSIGSAVSSDVPVSSVFIFIRRGTVMAFLGMQPGEDRDVSAGLRDFARMLALGIDEFVRSQGP